MNKIRTYYFPPVKVIFLMLLCGLLFFKINDIQFFIFSCVFCFVLFILLIVPESYTFFYNQKILIVKNRINFLYRKEFEFGEIDEIKVNHESFVGTSLIIILKSRKKYIYPSNFLNNSHYKFISVFKQNKGIQS